MSVGIKIRGLFGPFERPISAAYRAMYIDLQAFVATAKAWCPAAANLLEIGCGEGQVTERLRLAYPSARITAIDITSRLGRLYRGARERVRFAQCSVQDIAAQERGGFDLVILSDVMHHVPLQIRQGLLDATKLALAPGGDLVFKDWERTHTPIHWMCHASDRWLTGDRVAYMNRGEMRELLACSFSAEALIEEARIRPWRNNLAILVRPRS